MTVHGFSRSETSEFYTVVAACLLPSSSPEKEQLQHNLTTIHIQGKGTVGNVVYSSQIGS